VDNGTENHVRSNVNNVITFLLQSIQIAITTPSSLVTMVNVYRFIKGVILTNNAWIQATKPFVVLFLYFYNNKHIRETPYIWQKIHVWCMYNGRLHCYQSDKNYQISVMIALFCTFMLIRCLLVHIDILYKVILSML
jgi:hypothetical protein